MKLVLFITLFISLYTFSQDEKVSTTISKKGSFYVFWGWNRDLFSKSDLAFKGNDYNFILHDVAAKDRQSKLDANIYLNPLNATIPPPAILNSAGNWSMPCAGAACGGAACGGACCA